MGNARDVFVIHSQRNSQQAELFQAVLDWCVDMQLRLVSYEDWEWEAPGDPPPDALSQMPSHPWHYMPELNVGALSHYFRSCEVVLITDPGPLSQLSSGVAAELHALRHLEQTGPAPAVVVAATLDGALSDGLRDLVKEVVHVRSPRNSAVFSLLATGWLVSMLQRSGRIGLGTLDAGRRVDPYLDRFAWFGPFWQELPVDRMAPRSPMRTWWDDARELRTFMARSETDAFGRAWRVLAGAIESRLRTESTDGAKG